MTDNRKSFEKFAEIMEVNRKGIKEFAEIMEVFARNDTEYGKGAPFSVSPTITSKPKVKKKTPMELRKEELRIFLDDLGWIQYPEAINHVLHFTLDVDDSRIDLLFIFHSKEKVEIRYSRGNTIRPFVEAKLENLVSFEGKYFFTLFLEILKSLTEKYETKFGDRKKNP